MGRVDGKIALVTGAARGQGRAHALRLAEEGADILILDICQQVPGTLYDGATDADLAETVECIERLDRRVVAHKGDVRVQEDVDRLVAAGLQEFGRIDILVGNAGVSLAAPGWEITDQDWSTQVEINLAGCWRLAKGVIPHMIEAGNGGSIIFTSSVVAVRGMGNLAHYSASKAGLEGLARELAVDVGPHGIRVNTIQPGAVRTKMLDTQAIWELWTPGHEESSLEERRQTMLEVSAGLNALGVPWVEPEDIANAVLFLASDESRMVTGIALPVDAGASSLLALSVVPAPAG